MGISLNKEILDYGCLVVVVMDVVIDAHSGVFPPANELTIQNIVLTNIQLSPIQPIAMSAYLIPFIPSLYFASSPAAVKIMNPWYIK